MNFKIHLLEQESDENLAILRDHLEGDIQITSGEISNPADFDALVAGRPQRSHLQASSKLRLLVIPWAGVPAETRQLLKEFPWIAAHNLHHNDAATAEMAVALLLAAAKFIVPFDQALRRHDWGPRYLDPNPSMLLQGKTALVLGYGHIGRRVRQALQGLGMVVIGVRRSGQGRLEPGTEVTVYPPQALPELLPRTHALVITLPATPETEGLIGATQLERMPPGGILVNVGRGGIVDQAALYQSLRSRHLKAAGLDVWYNYPASDREKHDTPPADYPFHELDNVVLSPHRGGGAEETERLRMLDLAELINAAARGEPVPNRVDLDAGY